MQKLYSIIYILYSQYYIVPFGNILCVKVIVKYMLLRVPAVIGTHFNNLYARTEYNYFAWPLLFNPTHSFKWCLRSKAESALMTTVVGVEAVGGGLPAECIDLLPGGRVVASQGALEGRGRIVGLRLGVGVGAEELRAEVEAG